MRRGAVIGIAALVLAGPVRSAGESEPETVAEAIDAGRRAAWDADIARLGEASARCLTRLDRLSYGITVPFEVHPNGATRYEVKAGKAQFFDQEGLVWCGDVTLTEFSETGVRLGECRAERCLFNRKTRSCLLQGKASGVYRATRFEVDDGDGIYFSLADEFVKISAKIEIESTDLKFEGVKL